MTLDSPTFKKRRKTLDSFKAKSEKVWSTNITVYKGLRVWICQKKKKKNQE
jgi:hypothetical protein